MHTPESWEYRTTPDSGHEYCTVYAKGGRAIARHVLPGDAVAITAQPDLVAACKSALEDYYQTRGGACWCHELHDDLAPDTCVICKIQAALTKADVALQ